MLAIPLHGADGMPEKTPPVLELVLTRDDGLGRIAVDMQAFFDLSFDLAEDLQELIERWRHFAPPPKRPNLRANRPPA
jgi:hypothetical protein